MKTIIQLSADRTKAYWKWQWDEVHPLSEMFIPEIAELMVDVTDANPQPQEGWLYANKRFTPPPPPPTPPAPTPQELIGKLTQMEQEYINAHYTPLVQQAFNLYYVDARISADDPGKKLVEQSWDWGQAIGVYAQTIVGEIMAGTRTNLDDVDFAGQFDKADPQILLVVKDNKLAVISATEAAAKAGGT